MVRSSVAKRPANCWRSISSPVSRSVSRPRSMHSLAARSAQGAAFANPPAQASDGVVHLVGGQHPVDHADRQRLVGLDEPAGEDQVLGAARADQAGQPLGAAHARDHAEQHLGLAEGGVVGGEAYVGAEGQLAATAEGVAGDGRDHRLGDPGHRLHAGLEALGGAHHVAVRHRGHLLDVGAGGEGPLPAVEDDGADVVALARLDRGLGDLALGLTVEGVHLGPVDPDGADAVGHLQSHELTHADLLSRSSAVRGQLRDRA